MDEQPVDRVTVGFSPLGGDGALPAVGRTESDGSFRLTSMRGGAWQAGAPAGEYAVTFEKLGSIDREAGPPAPSPEKRFPKVVDPGHGLVPYLVFIPEAYGDRATSGLTATVKKGVNKMTFELRSDFVPSSAGELPPIPTAGQP